MAAIGDRMEEEEERLAERARELRRFVLEIVNVAFGTFFKTKLNIFVTFFCLRHNTTLTIRKSTGVFQFVTDNRSMITKAENARYLPPR